MFCGKCGAQVNEGAAFCPGCGSPIAQPDVQPEIQPQIQPEVQSEAQPGFSFSASGTNKKGLLVVAAAAVVVVVVLLIALFAGRRSIDKTIGMYMDAMLSEDGDAYVELLPDVIWEMMELTYSDDYMDDYVDMVEDRMEYVAESLDDRLDGIEKADFKIKEIEKVKGDELREAKKEFKEMFDLKLNIKSAATVEVEFEITGDDDDYENEATFSMVKIGRKWYLFDPGAYYYIY